MAKAIFAFRVRPRTYPPATAAAIAVLHVLFISELPFEE